LPNRRARKKNVDTISSAPKMNAQKQSVFAKTKKTKDTEEEK